MNSRNIVLIGFMGCGKSTVGQKLASALSYDFLDTDAIIEATYGKTIARMFEEDGEAFFRDAETEVLRKLEKEADGVVLATGGGMPMREENVALLKKIGTVVFLSTEIETILMRLQKDTGRPLADGEDREKKLRPLYEKRLPIYRNAADLCLHTEGKSFSEMIEEIETFMKNRE
ncbi:MAG: shikimate kinase [Lachnospiraceae bacterium]|nr:shikimate kinase [Lachnospiraceae bacterium]